MANICNDITETVGNTPLVRLNRTAQEKGAVAEILLKLDFLNPLASVKDRIAVAMIDEAIASGAIGQDTILIEPTVGNTGVALAFVAAARGLKLIVVLPDNVSDERRKLLKILGARLVLSDGAKGIHGAIDKAHELRRRIPNSHLLEQFSNQSNPTIHRRTTAEEIWRDTDGNVDFFVAGVGTGGTITGVAEAIKQRKPSFRAIAVEPAKSPALSRGEHGLHRIQGLGPGFIPPVLNRDVIDEVIRVDEDDCASTTKMVNQLDGIPVGLSSGAIIWAALQVAKRPENTGKQIVAMVPSAIERYLSSWLFDDMNLEGEPEFERMEEAVPV